MSGKHHAAFPASAVAERRVALFEFPMRKFTLSDSTRGEVTLLAQHIIALINFCGRRTEVSRASISIQRLVLCEFV